MNPTPTAGIEIAYGYVPNGLKSFDNFIDQFHDFGCSCLDELCAVLLTDPNLL